MLLLKLKHHAECDSERQPHDVSIVDLSQERPRLRTNACPAITTSTISLFNCELMRPTVPDELLLMHNFSVYPSEHGGAVDWHPLKDVPSLTKTDKLHMIGMGQHVTVIGSIFIYILSQTYKLPNAGSHELGSAQVCNSADESDED